MIQTIFTCLNRKISDEKVVLQQLKVTEVVYRDELTTKKSTSASKVPVKKSVRFANSEPTIFGDDSEKDLEKKRCSGNNELGDQRGRIRVKVKMTKEEAARLLSKCKEGGVLEFKDVFYEIGELPVNRVNVVSTTTKQ